jgi:hypothetical protein
MFAVTKLEELLVKSPSDRQLHLLKDLSHSLNTGTPFDLSVIAELSFENFNLAMDILRGWRAENGRTVKRKS